MDLRRIKWIKNDTNYADHPYSSYSEFDEEDIRSAIDIYVDVDNILYISPLYPRLRSGIRNQYAYYMVMVTGQRFWVKCNSRNYDGIEDLIPAGESKKTSTVKKSTSSKSRK